MPDYLTAARVLIAAKNAPVDLSDHCDIYSKAGRELTGFLERVAKVEKKNLGAPATSKAGAFIASPAGARVMATRITVTHNDSSRQLTADHGADELAKRLAAES